MKCRICGSEAAVALQSHNTAFCEKCYLDFFRRQVKRGIESQKLFTPEEKILVAISGGKDSLGLLLELVELGYQASGLFIDLAIPNFSKHARAVVEDFCSSHNLPLRIIELAGEGLAIPLVKEALSRPICSVCGKIKRHYFNKAAIAGGFDAIATGHNLDDETARLFSNSLRWDYTYLATQGPCLPAESGFVRKVKPLWKLTEFETANYAFLRDIPSHWQPCPYSQGASFSVLKNLLRSLEHEMPGRKIDFYQGFLERGRKAFVPLASSEGKNLTPCSGCGMPTSANDLCGVCRIKKAVREFQQKKLMDSNS